MQIGLEDALKEGARASDLPLGGQSLLPAWQFRVQGPEGNLCAESDLKMGRSRRAVAQLEASVSLSGALPRFSTEGITGVKGIQAWIRLGLKSVLPTLT